MTLLKSAAIKVVSSGMRIPLGAMERLSDLQTMRDLTAMLKVDCVIDVGANRGQFAHELRGVGYSGHIVSFEPLSSEFDVLSNGFSRDSRWGGRRVALGSRTDRLEMIVPGLTVLGSLLQPNFQSRNSRSEVVDVVRLDDVLPELLSDWRQRRIYLKMDTQGYDIEVFRGAQGILSCVVGLQSELSVQPLYAGMPHYLDALKTYEEAGFNLHNVSVVGRSEDGGVVEMNCYMRRREASS
jgi:FkbM family methyltransferase